MNLNKVKGDYQTPLYFTNSIIKRIKRELNFIPKVIYEPTCGLGSFIKSSNDLFSNTLIIGNEINEEYVDMVNRLEPVNNNSIYIYNKNYFHWDGPKEIENVNFKKEELLIVGNPPWVTNSYLSSKNSDNLPEKSNIKNLKGYDAITGSSNFDISEYIILDLILKYKTYNPLIAMICKTNVAYNVFKYINEMNIGASYMEVEEIDAKEVFNVSVGAAVFYLKLDESKNKLNYMKFKNLKGELYNAGYIDGNFYTRISENINKIDGHSEFIWRQGIKHDLSKVMELRLSSDNKYINGYKEVVDIENNRVFPLVKSSQLKNFVKTEYDRFVIVTQNRLKENTNYISQESPKLWEYLNKNKDRFEQRKSSIYKNSPPFSMFGIGDYTWKSYKVAVSGFYKKPTFSLLVSSKPAMLDDTSYYLSFDDYDFAYVTMLVLNSPHVQSFLSHIANLDAKRPYTKKILERISIGKAISLISYEELKNVEHNGGLDSYLTEKIYDKVKEGLQSLQLDLF